MKEGMPQLTADTERKIRGHYAEVYAYTSDSYLNSSKIKQKTGILSQLLRKLNL